MLPPALVSTCQRYKQDTTSIAAWLASTARSVGFTLKEESHNVHATAGDPKLVGGRLKGKARKQAQKEMKHPHSATTPPTTHIVKIKDFILLADKIASKSVPVPSSFGDTLDRVILARSEFAAKLEEHGAEVEDDSTKRHSHFVQGMSKILVQVKTILHPLLQTNATKAAPAANTETSLPNRFAGLTVHEPSQKFLDLPDVERPTKLAKDPDVYEIETPPTYDEMLFALASLADDMTETKSHIVWLWSSFNSGMFGLTAAAITTNTAIELIRTSMEEVMPLIEHHGGLGRVLQCFYREQCVMEGWNREDLWLPGEDNFNYETYDLAIESFFMTYHRLEDFCQDLKPGYLPLYKDGSLGYYDPNADRSQKSNVEKAQDDRVLLWSFCSELMTMLRATGSEWPIQDEFLRGMDEIDRTKTVPFYAVFAAQVFLDITYELGPDIERASSVMLKQTEFMDIDLERHFDFHSKLNVPRANDRALHWLHENIQWVRGDKLKEVQDNVYRQKGETIPDTPKHRIYKMSPVFSGLTLYHFRARYHEAGINIANASESIQCSWHLYNAAVRQGFVDRDWSDMNIAFQELGPSSFYIGVSAAALKLRTWRKNSPKASKAGPRGLKEASPVHSMFMARYTTGSSHLSLTPEEVDRIVQLSLYEAEIVDETGRVHVTPVKDQAKLKDKKRLLQEYVQGRRGLGNKSSTGTDGLGFRHLINSLLISLQHETLEFVFPYLSLHRHCWEILQKVKASCHDLLSELYSPYKIKKDAELPFIVLWILMAATTSEDKGRASNLRPLQEASLHLQAFMALKLGDSICGLLLSERFGMPLNRKFITSKRHDGEKARPLRSENIIGRMVMAFIEDMAANMDLPDSD